MGEDGNNINVGQENENSNPAEGTEVKTSEEKIAELKAEIMRLKKATDKATSEASSYKKKYNDTLSETEKRAMEKAEKDAQLLDELNTLRKEKAIYQYTASFMKLGYSEKNAVAAANAQFDGETDELFRLQQNHMAEMEKRIKADLMKKMPAPVIGNDDTISVTQEQFDAMDYGARLDLFNNHRSVYDKLAGY